MYENALLHARDKTVFITQYKIECTIFAENFETQSRRSRKKKEDD